MAATRPNLAIALKRKPLKKENCLEKVARGSEATTTDLQKTEKKGTDRVQKTTNREIK
jgi:hypothetical protein